MLVKFLINCTDLNVVYTTVSVGLLHLMLLVFRIYEVVMEMVLLEDLINLHKLLYLIFINVLQILLIISLFAGVRKQNPFMLVPWLAFTGPVFVMTTIYAILYSLHGQLQQSIFNFVFIALFWSSWLMILKNYYSLRQINQNQSFKNYQYSRLKGDT